MAYPPWLFCIVNDVLFFYFFSEYLLCAGCQRVSSPGLCAAPTPASNRSPTPSRTLASWVSENFKPTDHQPKLFFLLVYLPWSCDHAFVLRIVLAALFFQQWLGKKTTRKRPAERRSRPLDEGRLKRSRLRWVLDRGNPRGVKVATRLKTRSIRRGTLPKTGTVCPSFERRVFFHQKKY